MGCLGALFRLALVGVPAGLAFYVNTPLGWLIAACTVLILFCVYQVRDELVRSLPGQLEYYHEIRPRELQRQREGAEYRRELEEQRILLDAKVASGDTLTDEEQRVYNRANDMRGIREMEMRWAPR